MLRIRRERMLTEPLNIREDLSPEGQEVLRAIFRIEPDAQPFPAELINFPWFSGQWAERASEMVRPEKLQSTALNPDPSLEDEEDEEEEQDHALSWDKKPNAWGKLNDKGKLRHVIGMHMEPDPSEDDLESVDGDPWFQWLSGRGRGLDPPAAKDSGYDDDADESSYTLGGSQLKRELDPLDTIDNTMYQTAAEPGAAKADTRPYSQEEKRALLLGAMTNKIMPGHYLAADLGDINDQLLAPHLNNAVFSSPLPSTLWPAPTTTTAGDQKPFFKLRPPKRPAPGNAGNQGNQGPASKKPKLGGNEGAA